MAPLFFKSKVFTADALIGPLKLLLTLLRVMSFPAPEFNVNAPSTFKAALCVMALLVLFAVNVPEIVLAPKSMAAFSVTATFAPINAKLPNILAA